MPSTLSFNQCATLLNAINQQATGRTGITPTTTADFISMATTVLNTGYDPVISAISQVLSRTVFSVRPYNRKFGGLFMDSQRWGNHVRKLQVVDKAAEEDDRLKLVDGESVDQQKVNKPSVLQTNFYGANVYQRSVTIFRDQLDSAFSSPDEFGRFISMVMQNVSDLMEQDHENMARMTLANFIAAKVKADTGNVIHLVAEYNDATGLSLTSDTVKKPENFVPFMKWAYARIKTISGLMSERSVKYHMNIEGKPISRHTPKDRQKLYMYAANVNEIEASVLSSVYHDGYLKGMDFETVSYWQSIETPMGISIKPSYIDNTGAVVTSPENVVQSNILGVLFDEEAVGITTVNTWSAPAPFNARGGYTNTFWHYTDRYFNDLTENGVVFLLD